MKKSTKAIAIIGFCIILVSMFAVSALACSQNGYGSATLEVKYKFWPWEVDTATARLTKCDCNPVDNQLETFLRVQYCDGSNYPWYPEEDGMFIYDVTVNGQEASSEIKKPDINYALGVYYTRCKTTTADFHKEFSR